jgi:hypothetical protein
MPSPTNAQPQLNLSKNNKVSPSRAVQPVQISSQRVVMKPNTGSRPNLTGLQKKITPKQIQTNKALV